VIYGSGGSLSLPNDRSGRPLVLTQGDGTRREGEEALDLVPAFRLDPLTASLFGGERLGSYPFPFEETDRKLIAVEYGDFARAIVGDGSPEVDAETGARAVALSYAMLESGHARRPVALADVLAGRVSAYQAEIDQALFGAGG
jgi:hypothetical protein